MLVKPIEVLALDIDGVLTDGRVDLDAGGTENKRISFKDLDAVTQARRSGLRVALVTGEDGPLVDIVARRVGAETVLRGAKNKLSAILRLAAEMGTGTERICYVGDADRDAEAFAVVGLGLAPRDGSERARARAHRVLEHAGGAGAVAEAVQILLALSSDAGSREQRQRALRAIVEESIASHQRLLDRSIPALDAIAGAICSALRNGRKLLICGNGGSAADAQHIAAEFVGRFALERAALPAMALTTDTSILTAIGNDYDFSEIFARQVRAHARPGDVVAGLSTSGRSRNVLRALEEAERAGAVTIAFTGAVGGPIAELADFAFKAPSDRTARIQELHILGWHGICEVVEAALASASDSEETDVFGPEAETQTNHRRISVPPPPRPGASVPPPA